MSNRDGGALRAVHAGPCTAAPGAGNCPGPDRAGAGGAAGVLLLALFLPGKHGPAVVPYRGSNAGAYQYGDRFGKMKRQKKTLLSAKC